MLRAEPWACWEMVPGTLPLSLCQMVLRSVPGRDGENRLPIIQRLTEWTRLGCLVLRDIASPHSVETHLLLWFLESVMLPWGLSCHCPYCSHMHTMFLRSFIPLFTYGAGDGTQGLCTSTRQADRQALYH